MATNRADRVAMMRAQAVSALKLFVLFLIAAALVVAGALVYVGLDLVVGLAVAAVGVLVLCGAVARTYRFSNAA